MDIPCAPILADITVNGRPIKAIAQPTKQGWLYVFDRDTGQPVWPIEERPVEKGTVPGEWYSPTQPFVTQAAAIRASGRSVNDLIDFTPELKAEALKLVENYKIGPIFTPPVVEHVAEAAGDADAAGGHRRRELAGRRVRSGDEDVLHLHEQRGHSARSDAAGREPTRTWPSSRARRAIRTRRLRRPVAAAVVAAAAKAAAA